MSRIRAARRSHTTSALLLRRVEHGESDLVLSLFTRELGKLSALARGARKSRKRFGGALEPFQTLRVEVDEPLSGELFNLREASIEVTRISLTASLDAMDAAGRALGWVRSGSPLRTPEPGVWDAVTSLLDRLDRDGLDARAARLALAEHGLLLLTAFGWGLELERCVRCGKPCEPGRSAMVEPSRGGLVCRQCGGATVKLAGPARARLAEGALLPEDVDFALRLVERALSAHAGF